MHSLMIGCTRGRAVATDAMAEPVVAFHGEDLFGLFAVRMPRAGSPAWRCSRPGTRVSMNDSTGTSPGEQAGQRGGPAAGAEQGLEAGDHHIRRIGGEQGVVGVA